MHGSAGQDPAADLERFLAARLGPNARPKVSGLERASTGRSRENWMFDLAWSSNGEIVTERLIARRDPDGGLIDTDRSIEFEVLSALGGTGLPTPQARWLDADGSELGKPSLVMGLLPGDCDYYLINGERPLAERVALGQTLCELLAQVHQVDWKQHGFGEFLTDPGADAASHELEYWRGVLRSDQVEAYPELSLAHRWLLRRVPVCEATVLVHADFKAGNILLDGHDQVTGLLDWELAHLGDLHEDLGWITQPLRRREHLISGAWEAHDLLRHYESITGRDVDREAVRWWNVFARDRKSVV